MKMMRRSGKKLVLVLAAILCFSLLGGPLAGCKKDDGGGDVLPPDNTPVVASVTLNKASQTLSLFAEYKLTAQVKDQFGNIMTDQAVTWSSSNANAVSVSDGTVTGIRPGSAEITASAGEKSAKCDVTVTVEHYPSLYFGAGDSGEHALLIETTLALEPKVMFNGSVQTGAAFSFESYDESIFTVNSQGVISGVGIGEAELYVSAEWNAFSDESLSEVLLVRVTDSTTVLISGPQSSKISTVAPGALAGYSLTNEIDLTAEAYLKGAVIAGGTFAWSADEPDSVEILGGGGTNSAVTVTGKKSGTVHITAEFTKDGLELEAAPYKITIEFPVIDHTIQSVNTPISVTDLDVYAAGRAKGSSAHAGVTITSMSIFGAAMEIEEIYDVTEGRTKMTGVEPYAGGAVIYGYPSLRTGLKSNVLEIRNSQYGYLVDVDSVTRILYETSDLSVFRHAMAGSSYGEGHIYLLGADIDANGYTHPANGTWDTRSGTTYGIHGFRGIFDGRGHTIDGMTVQAGGLMGNMVAGSVVKNLALTDVTIKNSDWQPVALCLNYGGDAKVENVFVSVSGFKGTATGNGGILGSDVYSGNSGAGKVTFKNVVTLIDTTNGNFNFAASQTINSFFRSFTSTTGYAAITNCYVISNVSTLISGNSATTGGTPTRYADGAAFYAAKPDLTAAGLDANYWELPVNGYPVFITYTPLKNGIYTSAFNSLSVSSLTYYEGIGGAYDVPANLGPVTLSLLDTVDGSGISTPAGVSISGRRLAVDTAATAVDFVLKIDSTFVTIPAVLSKQIEVTIASAVVEEETDRYEMSKAAATDGTGAVTLSHDGTGTTDAFDDSGDWVLKYYNKATPATVVTAETAEYTFDTETLSISAALQAKLTAATAYDTANYVFQAEKGGHIVQFTNIMVITKVITVATDFNAFHSNNAGYGAGSYYVLGNNIDATAYEMPNHQGWNPASNPGFAGIFDGRGYTIDGATTNTNGFFGSINNGTVINVAITNLKIVAKTDNVTPSNTAAAPTYQVAALGLNIMGTARIENVYLTVKDITSAGNGNLRGLLGILAGTGVTVKDVVFIMVVGEMTVGSTLTFSTTAAFCDKYENARYIAKSTSQNVYLVTAESLFNPGAGGIVTSGGNDVAAGTAKTNGLLPPRYATAADFAAAKATPADAGLSETYWKTGTDGHPVFITAEPTV